MNVITLFIFYMGQFWPRERFSHLPQVTQSVTSQESPPQVLGLQSSWSPNSIPYPTRTLPVLLPSVLSPPYIPGSCSSLGCYFSISLPLETSAHHSISSSPPAPLYLSSCLFSLWHSPQFITILIVWLCIFWSVSVVMSML